MTDDMEIDPHHYVIARAAMRYVPIAELLALVSQNIHLVEGVAHDYVAAGQPVARNADGSFEVYDGAMSNALRRHEFTIPVAIQPIAKPPGYDWRAQQARVPRNGKTKTQWPRRHP